MAMTALTGNLNLSLSGGIDYAGALLLSITDKLIATGYYEQAGAGDGVATFVTSTTPVFTAGTGYKTSGTWGTPLANSVSNPLAWRCLKEKDASGTPTGRQLAFQRGSGSALGNDRFNVIGFSRAGWSGTPSATSMFPTGTFQNVWDPGASDTFGGAGSNIFSNLAGTCYLSGSATINHSVLVPDGPSTSDVMAWLAFWNTSVSAGGVLFYESIVLDGATYPYIVGGDTQARVSGSATLGAVPTSFNDGPACFRAYNQSGTAVTATFETKHMPDGTNRPSNTTPVQAGPSGYPIYPLELNLDTATSSTPWGYCESMEYLLPGGTAWMALALFDAAVAAAEPPRCSLGVITVPWLLGQALTDSPGTRTDVYSVIPQEVEVVPDTTLPTVELVSPLNGRLGKFTSMVIDVDDDAGIRLFVLYSIIDAPSLLSSGFAELIYDGADPNLHTLYNIIGPTEVGGKQRYSITRKGGWPSVPVRLRARVVDTSGNLDD